MASRIGQRLAAPRAEFVAPRSSRVTAINGTDNGVNTTASSALRPFDADVAAPGALLGVAVGPPDGVVEVDEYQLITGVSAVSLASSVEATASSHRTCPMMNARRNVPSVEGARTRRTADPSRPAQQVHVIDRVRPAGHPGDQREAFAVAFAPPFAAIVSRLASSVASRTDGHGAITGTSPAQDTRFGSSKRTLSAARVR